MKPKLFQYWETPENLPKKPGYIELCEQTVDKYCSDGFEIERLNRENIKDYLPELDEGIWGLGNIALVADYIRARLLYKYGGLWLDADTIVMQPLTDIVERLDEGSSFVGYRKTSHGDDNISVNFMGGIKNSAVFRKYGEIQDGLLQNSKKLKWSSLGADALDKALKKATLYESHFYPESRIQPIPWQEQKRFYRKEEEVENVINEDTLTCMIFNNGMKTRDQIPDVRLLDKEQLMEIPILLTKLLKYSLEK